MANNDPPGLRYLTEWEDYYALGSITLNVKDIRFYLYVTKNAKAYLVIHDDWTIANPGTYAFICEYKNKRAFMNQVQGLIPTAYAVYEYPIPMDINTFDAVVEYFRTVNPKAWMVKDYGEEWGSYKLEPYGSIVRDDYYGFDGFVLDGYASFTAELRPLSRSVIGIRLGLQEYRLEKPDEMHRDIKNITVFKPDGISGITEDLTPVNGFVPIPKKYFSYDARTNTYSLTAMIFAKQNDDHPKIGDLVVSGVLDFSQFPATPFPDVRYIQLGNDKTTVGFGEHWYDRPAVKPDQIMGTLKYVAKNVSQVNSTQTLDQRHPGTYSYQNNETSRNGYPAEGVDGIATFGFSWDGENGLQDHIVRLYKDPHVPGLYSIRPNYDYTNICHHGHVANSAGSHWFALPGRLVETATLGTNVDYTDRRTTLMDAASRLTVSDDFVGDYWEKGRLVLLNGAMTVNGTSKTGTSISTGVKSQLSNKPYNYYYGNSFLKNNAGFDQNPTNVNVSVDYGEEDKLPNINQDFTTNCGYHNSSRELSDWTISRVYYDHKKRLRFGQEDSSYSRVNYRGAIRNLTPGGIAPAVGGIATLVNGGTLRAQSGTTSLFVNAPQCAVIEGDIIVDATGNNSEIPLELYKNDTLIVGVLIMRGRILIKGSNHSNPLIGIKNPTLIINETHWDFDQLFTAISNAATPGSYRVVGAYLLDGNSIIFVEDTNGNGIPREISSLSDVTVINIGLTSLSTKPVFAIAGNIYSAKVPSTSYFHFENIDTGNFLNSISRYLVHETLRFGYNSFGSVSYPHYLTMPMQSGVIVGGNYPENHLQRGPDNHALYVYDLTGKFKYSNEERFRYRKEYRWFYNLGTIDGFREFVKETMKKDDNRELINAKRVIVTYLRRVSGPTYRMFDSMDAALRSIPWANDVDIAAKIYAFD